VLLPSPKSALTLCTSALLLPIDQPGAVLPAALASSGATTVLGSTGNSWQAEAFTQWQGKRW
jgi:hypothetical protein